MKYAVLASGSKGNATLVCSEKTVILIDCGISRRKLEERLAQCGLGITDISAVLVTHSHSDHSSGLKMFNVSDIYASLFVLGKNVSEHNILSPYVPRTFGDLTVTPLPLSHDAVNTTGYLITDGEENLVYITDTGFVPEKVLKIIQGADYYIFESNHDPKMLCESKRPPDLIRRILGDQGHLSNVESAYYLSGLVTDRTKEITLAHLSEECNTKEKAVETFNKVMMTQLGEIPDLLLRCADEYEIYKGGKWLKAIVE